MSEDIDKLNQAVRDLNQTLQSLTGNVGNLSDSTARATVSTSGLNEVEKSRLEAQKKLHEHELQLKDAAKKAGDSLGNFAKGILDTNVKLTNLNEGLSSAGDAAYALGKAFGPLGALVGGLVKGFTMLIEANLKISQAYLEGKDSLSKMGGAGAHTTASIQKMAREADLNAETLGRMIKPMKGLGSDIMILGNNAGAAQKEFAELIKATSEEREMMSRLGINQEEMMQGTADYLALQAASGRSVKNELQDREKLRRASIDYQTSLLDLAALTGKDVATLKEKQKEAALDAQRQIKDMADTQRINELKKKGDGQSIAQAEQIQKEMDARNKALDSLIDAPEALRVGAKEMIIAGTISGEASKTLARNNMQGPVAELAKTIKEGGDGVRGGLRLQDQYYKKQADSLKSRERALLTSDQARKDFDFADLEGNKRRAARMNAQTTLEEEYLKQLEQRQAGAEPGADPEADARAKLQEANIKATGAVEDVITTLNPLKLGFVGLAAAAGAAALALGIMAKRGMLSGGGDSPGMMGRITGMFGGGGGGKAGAPSPGASNAGAIAEGLGRGSPGGGPGFLENAAKGLAAFANPKVVVGAGAFGIAIAAVGAGIAGATWIISKALPSLAEGLAPFEKLDGDKLKATGIGMTALAGGMAAFGAGTAIAGIGNIVGSTFDKLGARMGADGPFKKLEDFSKLNIDAGKVKENAEAFTAFGKAMAAGGAGSALGSATGLMGGLMDKLSGKLDLKGPLKQLEDFGAIKVNVENVKNNADAMVIFGEAMSKYKGTNESMWGTLTAGVAGFFKQDPPTKKMEAFAKIDLGTDGPERVKSNAQAFVYFSQALSEFKGTSELKNAADNIVGGIVKMFGGDDVMGKFVKFTKLDVDPDRALKLGQAFAAYSSAMNSMTGGGAAATPAPRTAPAASSRAAGGGGGGGGGGGSAASATGGGGGVSPKPATQDSGGVLNWAAKKLGIGGGAAAPASSGDDPEGKVSGGGGVDVKTADAGDAAKGPRKKTDGIIVHHTGGRGLQAAIDTLKARGLGYHYMVDRDGSITEFVPGDQKAWHAGKTDKKPELSNSNTVSISLVAKDDKDVTKEQLKAGFGLGKDLMSKYGASSVAGHGETSSHKHPEEGKTLANALRVGKIEAKNGGLASGPNTGYPATLHGNEMIIPLDPKSILAELGKKTSAEIESQMIKQGSSTGEISSDAMKELTSINQSMMDMMASKLDAVIDRLEAGNDTQGKLLKYSQA